MTTDKQEAEIVATCRERYADYLQASFYEDEQGMMDVFERYVIEHCLPDDEEADELAKFEMERHAGLAGEFTAMHKTVSDLCWKKAQSCTDTEWLKNEFYHSHKYN